MKAPDRREKIAVIVGTVTNDVRILTVPKLTVRQYQYQIEFISMLRMNFYCLIDLCIAFH